MITSVVPYCEMACLYPTNTYRDSKGNIFVSPQIILSFETNFTESASDYVAPEPSFSPYECCRDSGVLDFWNDPSEDIYTFEDGHPL